ncbi:hypothetical protein [Agarivorans aestuarii]|uniref:hypothetical protein n=1 Tax=Agarivorans aestuarii TaxID=1563703 RepID=UPI001C7FFCEA|nr:hypothetical protein [Agarivorans aestuarii]
MSDGLIRQRRNFLLFSILVACYIHLGIKIKELSIFGLKIELGDSHSVFTLILLFWIYFGWRFYQYQKQDAPCLVSTIYSRCINLHTKDYIEKVFLESYPNIEKTTLSNFVHGDNLILSYKRFFAVVYEGEIETVDEQEGRDNRWFTEKFKVEIRFSIVKLTFFRLKGALSFCYQQACFSDYVLPYLLASSVFLYLCLDYIW